MIELRNISFAYEESPVIENISIKFDPGSFYSLLGPNGCGKTTLLDLMIGHLKPGTGDVLIHINDAMGSVEKHIALMSKKDIARQIALVSQNYNISFPFTVRDVIMMGRHPYIGRFESPSEKDIRIVNRVMESTGTERFAQRKITELSGGERQRCVFARALSQDTPLLFLDEAFSNMDISYTMKLLGIVKKEVREYGKTVISVFHDINLAAIWSDRLVFMRKGKIVAYGNTDDVMTDKTIEDVFHVKSKVEYNPYSEVKQVYFKGYDK